MNEKEFLAHTAEDGRVQPLAEHLRAVAELAKAFVADADEALCPLAEYVGRMHDIGKYQQSFQRRLAGEAVRVDHAVAGAKDALCDRQVVGKDKKDAYLIAAYIIAGHHAGLADFGFETDRGVGTLYSRLKTDLENYDVYREEIGTNLVEMPQFISQPSLIDLYARLIYSCLTDADFLDTERFMSGGTIERGIECDFTELLEKYEDYMKTLRADSPIKAARGRLRSQVEAADSNQPIAFLDMPTGSGKTLASLGLALKTAVERGKKRIIYVIPYTSIIEQTAAQLKQIFGEKYVLEHHADFTYEAEGSNRKTEYSEDDIRKLARATENWDAPIVVTTSVQFFESIYKNRSSKLRKMHNMADAVLIFDEIQLLPLQYLDPCLRAIEFLCTHCNSRALLMSATMPDPDKLSEQLNIPLGNYSPISDHSDYAVFRKCEIQYLDEIGDETFKNYADDYESLLIVVPTRKEARRIFRLMDEAFPDRRVFHLSTYMNAVHRRASIAEIRQCLADGTPTIVVSTSLIEAGVDLDFACVLCPMTGLDSILQCAGRCNREGKREGACTYVYENKATKGVRNADQQWRRFITKQIFKRFGDVQSAVAIRTYFSMLYDNKLETIEGMKRKCKKALYENEIVCDFQFRTYAEKFRFIDSNTRTIVAPYGPDGGNEGERLLEEFRRFPDKSRRRRLQSHAVNIYENEFKALCDAGAVCETEGVWYLSDPARYDSQTGLLTDEGGDFIYW